MASAITFPAADTTAFGAEVEREVAAYFERRGLSRKANTEMIVKTVVVLGVTVGCYFAILLTSAGAAVKLLLAVLMGVGAASIGFAIAHDAAHGAYSQRAWVNAALTRLFDAFGASSYLWNIRHNVIHHTYPNIDGADEDLALSPVMRLSPASPLYPIHRWQHLYFCLAYCTSTFFWVFTKDYELLLKRDLGPYRRIKHPAREVVLLIAWKLFYYGWSVVVPLLVLDLRWWQFLIGYFAMQLTCGFIVGVITQVGHLVEGPEYALPDAGGRMRDNWVVHQMRTTANFAPNNRFIGWYVGGLTFHIEHHLFPKTCSVHYPAIAPIVASVARRHGLPYYSHPTLRAVFQSHYRVLRALGAEAWAQRPMTGAAAPV